MGAQRGEQQDGSRGVPIWGVQCAPALTAAHPAPAHLRRARALQRRLKRHAQQHGLLAHKVKSELPSEVFGHALHCVCYDFNGRVHVAQVVSRARRQLWVGEHTLHECLHLRARMRGVQGPS